MCQKPLPIDSFRLTACSITSRPKILKQGLIFHTFEIRQILPFILQYLRFFAAASASHFIIPPEAHHGLARVYRPGLWNDDGFRGGMVWCRRWYARRKDDWGRSLFEDWWRGRRSGRHREVLRASETNSRQVNLHHPLCA